MAFLHSALCIFQSIISLGSRKGRSHDGTDWLKLALTVAARPDDDDSRSVVRTALRTNNQEFLDYLRSALDTRSAAATRVAEINEDGVECRAFLPGSPALWGWTTNLAAEAAVLQAGIEVAIQSSIFDSPAASCSKDDGDIFVGVSSSHPMGGATLRDIYAKAWELYREPLIWTPRGPGAGVGASTWTLTPVSLVLPAPQGRSRRASDASDMRSSVVELSPCLLAQRNRVRRSSLHDVFVGADAKQKGVDSPLMETGMATPSSSFGATALPPLDLEPLMSRHRRSASCTRSHVSSTTAMTVSECSTPREIRGFGPEISFNGSICSRPSTPSEICSEVGKGKASKRRDSSHHHLVGRVRIPSAFSRASEVSGTSSLDNSKQFKPSRPEITPLQRVQASLSRRVHTAQELARSSSGSRTGAVYGTGARPEQSLRYTRSMLVTPLPPPQFPKRVTPQVPLMGPVPAGKRALSKLGTTSSRFTSTRNHEREGQQEKRESSLGSSRRTRRITSMPTTPVRSSYPSLPTPSTTRSRIPRPPSRTALVASAEGPSVRSSSNSKPKPWQPLTPASTLREQTSFSKLRTGGSAQEYPPVTRSKCHSRPPSRAHTIDNSDSGIVQRSKRLASSSSMQTATDR